MNRLGEGKEQERVAPLITTSDIVCPPPLRVNWSRTLAIQTRLADSPDYELPDASAPYGRFQGRPIIGSGMSRIIGGVYLGMTPREATVVAEYPDQPGNLLDFYNAFIQHMDAYIAKSGVRFKSEALGAIYQLVMHRLRYCEEGELKELVGKIVAHGGPDQKITLHYFLNEGRGACTHQALLVGYMIEKLMGETDPEKQFNGAFSIERNSVAIGDIQVGAHCWVRYTTANEKVIVIDVAQKRFDTLENLKKDPQAWFYDRVENINSL